MEYVNSSEKLNSRRGLLAKLSTALERKEPHSCLREDAEYYLRSIRDKNKDFTRRDIEYMLTAGTALELDAVTLN